jgi:hypothetical protein
MRRGFSAGCLLALVASIAHAQARNGPLFGAGIEAAGYKDFGAFHPGLSLQAGYAFSSANSRLGVRLVGTYFRRQRLQRTEPTLRRLEGGTFSLETTYSLGLSRTRPYLIGGAGVSYMEMERSQFITNIQSLPSGLYRNGGVSPFGLVGMGVEGRVLGLSVFGESRLAWMFGLRSVRPNVMPLTFGVRF